MGIARSAVKVLRIVWIGLSIGVMADAAIAAPETASDKADECLKSPKGATPPGERWYYRVERGTKRHCWYTRASAARKTVAQRAPAAKAVKNDTPLDAEPLQLSVANARAEADLSAPPPPAEPRDAQPVTETRNLAWTLADRWSQNSDATPAVQTQAEPAKLAPTLPPTGLPDAVEADTPDNTFVELAAGTVALLGLSVALIAVLVRRRQRDRPVRAWRFSQRDSDEPPAPLTDLNEEPLMTWRKDSLERLQIMRRAAELRDATSQRNARLSPTGSADFRRTPTIPPGARA